MADRTHFGKAQKRDVNHLNLCQEPYQKFQIWRCRAPLNQNVFYFGFSALSAVFGNYFPRIGCLLASRSIFFFFVDGVINAPLSFMDVTPSGRILVRFLKDLDVMDYSLPLILHDMVYCLIQVCLYFSIF